MTTKIRRAIYEQRGADPTEYIHVVEEQSSGPEQNQVLVEVLAAPINPSDVLTLTGEYGMLPPLPAVGGNEGVGRVVQVGADVSNFSEGDVVLLPLGSGTWQSHAILNTQGLTKLPQDVDPIQLSMISVNPPTASLLLQQHNGLEAGDWLIQNAANSAVGTYVNQLAKLANINVINLVRREGAVQHVKDNGGEHVFVDDEHLEENVKAQCGDIKAKLALDAVGGASTSQLVKFLDAGATCVNYGALSGENCSVSPRDLIFKGIILKGFWLASWFQEATPEGHYQVYSHLVGLIAQDKLSTPIAQTYTLDHIKDAVSHASRGERDGKIVIRPNS